MLRKALIFAPTFRNISAWPADNTALQVAWALLLSGAFCGVAWRLRSLSLSGFAAATILGMIILGLGGWDRVYPLLAFFISSSLLSKARGRWRGAGDEAKGSRRDAVQVLANGGIAALVVLIEAALHRDLFPVYLGSLAAANADTWSTEIGMMLGRRPRSIATGKLVAPGSSGGVTAAGIMASLVGAIFIAWVGRLIGASQMTSTAPVGVAAAGLFGSLLDSFIGATLQARFRCSVCEKETENWIHCTASARLMRGWRWLSNDGVNLVCTSAGALCAALFI